MPGDIKKLGIIAGGGTLPDLLQDACEAQNIVPYIVGFQNFTDQVEVDYWARIGAAQKTLKWLHSNNVKDLVFIGSLERPDLWKIRPDMMTMKVFFKAWLGSFGDSDLLSAARTEIEKHGFYFHGVHKFLPDLLMREGQQGQYAPDTKQEKTIRTGVEASQELGRNDIGQAVIVKDGKVIARENQRGTNTMITHYGDEGAILVKTCKPQQDMDLDLPTIGPKTVQLCAEKKMAGIVAHAGKSLFVGTEECITQANNNNMFIVGIGVE